MASAGTCHERFFAIRKEFPAFLLQFVASDIAELEGKLQNLEFLKELAFLTDFTNHLNELNFKMQGKDKTILYKTRFSRFSGRLLRISRECKRCGR